MGHSLGPSPFPVFRDSRMCYTESLSPQDYLGRTKAGKIMQLVNETVVKPANRSFLK